MPSLALAYTGRRAENRDLLILEQERWSLRTGRITTGQVARLLMASLAGTGGSIEVDCGLQGGAIVCQVYAYPLVEGLDYRLLTSWGSLDGPYRETIEIEAELVQFRMESEARTRYPARRIMAAAWVDECLDRDGLVVDPPALTIDGQQIRADREVYGTVEVRYLVDRHSYTLTAPRREAAAESRYEAALIAPIPGHAPVWLAVEMPPSIASLEAEVECGRLVGSGTVTMPEGGYVPPEPPASDLITEIDYCTQTVLREYTEP